jgi:putative transposase
MATDDPPLERAPSPEALFRYLVLGQVEALVRTGVAVSRAVRTVARRDHPRADGHLVRVSVRTVQRWRARFSDDGLAGLEPKSRTRTDSSVVLPSKLVDFLVGEKKLDPRASIPELLRRARVRGVISQQQAVDRTTVWRACGRLGLPTRVRPTKHEADTRRFSYPHRMQCVLCDGKHFRAGAGRLRRVALFFLDDASRYGLHVVVGTAESAELFLRGLHALVRKHGLMGLVYVDAGPGFISGDTAHVVQNGLGAWLVHGRRRYPEGHGKIERFNRTTQAAVLRSLPGAADVDPSCVALELRLQHYLDHDYNERPHESLSGVTPRQRWESDTQPLRFPEDDEELWRHFLVTESRSVSADHVIRQGGKLWEAPRGLARTSVEVKRHVLSGRLYVVHRGELVRLHELDPHRNALERRGYRGDEEPLADEGVPTTAATAAFQRDMAPITGPDGGFRDPGDQ